jgi:hypothetical protein
MRHGAQLTIMTNPAGRGIIVEVMFPEPQALSGQATRLTS